MEHIDKCKGCFGLIDCRVRRNSIEYPTDKYYQNKVNICPCTVCLVKLMCTFQPCLEYIDWRKEYEKHLRETS